MPMEECPNCESKECICAVLIRKRECLETVISRFCAIPKLNIKHSNELDKNNMTEENIEAAFFYIGQLKGHVDGLHIELKKPEAAELATTRAFDEIVGFMHQGSKAIRTLRNKECQ
jgi:hypothetical protein